MRYGVAVVSPPDVMLTVRTSTPVTDLETLKDLGHWVWLICTVTVSVEINPVVCTTECDGVHSAAGIGRKLMGTG